MHIVTTQAPPCDNPAGHAWRPVDSLHEQCTRDGCYAVRRRPATAPVGSKSSSTVAPGIRLFRHVGTSRAIQLNLQFEPRDGWIGYFWRVTPAGLFHLYVCLVPFLPLHLTIMRTKADR